MKDIMSIWSRLAGRSYSSVSTNPQPSGNDSDDYSDSDPRSLQTKSTIVVNKFFNKALPVYSDGRRKWPKSKLIISKSKAIKLLFFKHKNIENYSGSR